jgi:hypothetical protein
VVLFGFEGDDEVGALSGKYIKKTPVSGEIRRRGSNKKK